MLTNVGMEGGREEGEGDFWLSEKYMYPLTTWENPHPLSCKFTLR